MALLQPTREERRSELVEEALGALERTASRHWRMGPGAHAARRDLSLSQMHMLILLRELGPRTVGQLAERLHVSLPSASAMVHRLQANGLVVRSHDESDRRLVHVRLSARGESEAEEAAGMKREAARRVLSQFETRELDALLQVLGAAERVLKQIQPDC